MATLKYSSSLVKFFLSSSLLLFSFFLKKSYALQGTNYDNIESHFHIVEITSLLPSSLCSPSTTKGSNEGQSTLEVTHRHGPCSQLDQDRATTSTPSLSEVLSYDRSRVDWIRYRVESNSNTNKLETKRATLLPVQSGESIDSGNYIVAVGLGTPKRTLSLEFDTGSDLTWTQCQPCAGSCYRQQDPIFNPSSSSSYSNVSCDSAPCSQLSTATGNDPGCTSTTCLYGIAYADRSYSEGFFGKDKLTITSTDVFPNFLFGCGQDNRGSFGKAAGLLGLGRHPLSIGSQTAKKYGKYFSYCLPSTSSSKGYLKLGKSSRQLSRNIKYTPLATSHGTMYYFIDILSISVAGRQLPVNQSVFKTAGGSIIDSGTVITRLPPTAYSAMRTSFKKLMAKYPRAPAYSILDTCYDLKGHETITIPTMSFTFRGDVELDLAPLGIVINPVATSRIMCLAFAGNDDADDGVVFGNTQQKTLEVVYDVAGGKLGFGPAGCK